MCAPTCKPTSSPASEAGPTPSNSLAGETDLFGQALAPASHSLLRGSRKAMRTGDISGPPGTISSASAILSQSLPNRLAARLGSAGSMLWQWTWKRLTTRLGRAKGYVEKANGVGLNDQSLLAAWPTASSRDWKDTPGMAETGTNPEGTHRTRLDQLPRVAQLATWPTPMAGSPATESYNEAGNTDSGRKTVALVSGWVSPTAEDHRRGLKPPPPPAPGGPPSHQEWVLAPFPPPRLGKTP